MISLSVWWILVGQELSNFFPYISPCKKKLSNKAMLTLDITSSLRLETYSKAHSLDFLEYWFVDSAIVVIDINA